MKKSEAIELFNSSYPELRKGSGVDYWTAQFAWSCFTDGLCKDGTITTHQYETWSTPFPYGKQL